MIVNGEYVPNPDDWVSDPDDWNSEENYVRNWRQTSATPELDHGTFRGTRKQAVQNASKLSEQEGHKVYTEPDDATFTPSSFDQ